MLEPGALACYQLLARQPVEEPRPADRVRVDFIAQRGRYADVTSVLEGAEHLRTGDVHVVFADDVDVTHTALPLLAAAVTPGVPAVLAMLFDVEAASHKGVVVCSGTGSVRTMLGLVEKPSRPQAERLAEEYGEGALRLLLGRMRITPDLLGHLVMAGQRTAAEPKPGGPNGARARGFGMSERSALTRLTGNGNGECGEKDCPNVYRTATGSFVVQGDMSDAFTPPTGEGPNYLRSPGRRPVPPSTTSRACRCPSA